MVIPGINNYTAYTDHYIDTKQTDVNTVNQLLTYSKQAEAGMHQKAIQILLG